MTVIDSDGQPDMSGKHAWIGDRTTSGVRFMIIGVLWMVSPLSFVYYSTMTHSALVVWLVAELISIQLVVGVLGVVKAFLDALGLLLT